MGGCTVCGPGIKRQNQEEASVNTKTAARTSRGLRTIASSNLGLGPSPGAYERASLTVRSGPSLARSVSLFSSKSLRPEDVPISFTSLQLARGGDVVVSPEG